MPLGDDDDIFLSASSEQTFSRADHGRKEQLKKEIGRKFGAVKESKVQETELKSQLNLSQLKKEISTDGQKDEETKRAKDDAAKSEKSSKAPKTKTIKQMEESAIGRALDNADPDTMIERQEQQQEIDREETQAQAG